MFVKSLVKDRYEFFITSDTHQVTNFNFEQGILVYFIKEYVYMLFIQVSTLLVDKLKQDLEPLSQRSFIISQPLQAFINSNLSRMSRTILVQIHQSAQRSLASLMIHS